jgi:hypothetical protein
VKSTPANWLDLSFRGQQKIKVADWQLCLRPSVITVLKPAIDFWASPIDVATLQHHV